MFKSSKFRKYIHLILIGILLFNTLPSNSQPFSTAFKEFDQSNGYKGLKFGTTFAVVNKSASLAETDAYKLYIVLNNKYNNWFHINFDNCFFTFNKKNLFSGAIIEKDQFSETEYATLLSDALDLFGNTNSYKIKSDDEETTTWTGKNITVIIFRLKNKDINVQFISNIFNDASESDKLY
jgi:hypothetical protein